MVRKKKKIRRVSLQQEQILPKKKDGRSYIIIPGRRVADARGSHVGIHVPGVRTLLFQSRRVKGPGSRREASSTASMTQGRESITGGDSLRIEAR